MIGFTDALVMCWVLLAKRTPGSSLFLPSTTQQGADNFLGPKTSVFGVDCFFPHEGDRGSIQ